MKALLIQARDPEDAMREHERNCFLAQTGLGNDQMTVVNALDNPSLPVDEADVIFVGGSGDYSATAALPWMQRVTDAIHRGHSQQKPIFGSCWGFHMIARAFGGNVITNEQAKELGTIPIYLTPEGRQDPIFSALSSPFLAQLGHKDHVQSLPENAIRLAYNDNHRNQAFRISGTAIYATQFHPELTADDMRMRIRHYLDQGYVSEEEKVFLNQILESFQETPECSSILRKFVEYFTR